MKEPGISKDDLSLQHSEIVQQLKAELNEKDRQLEEYRSSHGILEVFFNRIEEAITPVKIPDKLYQSTTERRVDSPVIACCQITDTHYGAVQVADEIEGFGEFSPEICKTRSIDFIQRLVKWVEMHRMSYQVDEIAVLITGDLISGDIHDELQRTNAFPVPVQCVQSAQLVATQISLLAANFKKVTVHFLVSDNHSRLTRKPQAKEEGYNSYNYVVGKIIEIYLKDHDNIEYNIYPQHEKVISVSTRQYLIAHGHGIRGWMGVPWYSITRHVGKESTARLQLIMDDITKAKDIGFHKYVFGHWHTPFDSTLYSCAGSVSGTDAYDHGQGRHELPSQPAWLVHPKHGEFNRVNFTLH